MTSNLESLKSSKEAAFHAKGQDRTLWLDGIKKLSPIEYDDRCKQAMSAFLDKTRNIGCYSRYFWAEEGVVQSWTEIKDHKFNSLGAIIIKKLSNVWTHVNQRLQERTWLTFSNTVYVFCLAAGCPKADRRDPFKSLEMLRDSISRQLAYTSDLHNKISELNKQIILQQRMITALAYRNTLENISSTNAGFNPTEKWRAFIDKMLRNVGDEGVTIMENNPLKALIDQHKDNKTSLSILKQTAYDLYSTLSRTIHHPSPFKDPSVLKEPSISRDPSASKDFSPSKDLSPSEDFDPYIPIPGQFDQVQIKFMSAMKPQKMNLLEDGSFNWDEERGRYTEPVKPRAVAPATDQVSGAEDDQKQTTKVSKSQKKKNKNKKK